MILHCKAQQICQQHKRNSCCNVAMFMFCFCCFFVWHDFSRHVACPLPLLLLLYNVLLSFFLTFNRCDNKRDFWCLFFISFIFYAFDVFFFFANNFYALVDFVVFEMKWKFEMIIFKMKIRKYLRIHLEQSNKPWGQLGSRLDFRLSGVWFGIILCISCHC